MNYIDYSITKRKKTPFEHGKKVFFYVKKSIKWLLYSVIVMGVLFLGILFSLHWINPSFTAFTIQENWEELGKERYSLREKWVPFEDIPENLKWAVVASEDQKFWNHNGVDIEAIGEAWEEMESGERVRGASTITQQVVKNLFLTGNKTFVRKGVEAVLAVIVDAMWGKERVLEMYLNIAEFGPGIYGVGRASEHFFQKNAKNLRDEESARMAAVLPNPKRMRVEPASPYVEKRKIWILKNMMNLSGITYYKSPHPKQVESDSTSRFEDTFIQKIDVSNWNYGLSTAQDSTNNLRF